MAKDAFYFPHDSNARDDPKCSLLIEQLGLEGFGIFWVLIEILREQPSYRYPLALIPVIARKYNTTSEKIRVVIGNYGLFTIDADEFFSLSLNRRMERIEKLRELNRIKGKKSGERRRNLPAVRTTDEPQFNRGSTGDEQIKRNKNNEINTSDPFSQALDDFAEHRRKLKKPMTDRAKKLLLADLDKLAETDREKILIIEQSILQGWSGVFALKQHGKVAESKPAANSGAIFSYGNSNRPLFEEQ